MGTLKLSVESAIMKFICVFLLLTAVTVCYSEGGKVVSEEAYKRLQAENEALTAENKRLKQGLYNPLDAARIQGCKCQDGWFGQYCDKQAVPIHIRSKTNWGT